MLRNKPDKSIFSIISAILPYRFKLAYAGIIFTTVIINFLEGVGIGLVIPLLELLNKGPDPEKQSLIVRKVFVFLQKIGINPSVHFLLLAIFILISLRVIFFLFHSRLIDTTLHKTTELMRNRAFANLMDVRVDFYHQKKVGELTNSIVSESLRGSFVIRGIINLLSVIILVLFYACVLFIFSRAAVITVVAISLISYFLVNRLLVKTKILGLEKSRFNDRMSVFCIEVLTSAIFIKSFALEEKIKNIFNKFSRDIQKNWVSLSYNRRLLECISNLIQVSALVLLIYILLDIFHFTIGYLIGTIFILFRLLPFMNQINIHRHEISEDSVALKNIYYLGLKQDKPYLLNGDIKTTSFKVKIEFKQVSFAYQKDKLVLNNINLEIHKGQSIGIIGASGAGKSTLLFLIPRLYDPTEGQILVDGINIKDFNIRAWRENIGIITQETFIFNDSIKNNLLLIKPDASSSELSTVLELSHMKEFVSELPQGLETVVGDRGIKFSGGQKQRLAIARVFLKNPEILIMDEATSSLDSISERYIQQSIERLKEDRTVIIVAHRLSTVKNVDKIIVLEQGKITEEGSPGELLARKGQYFKYLEQQ